MKTVQEKIEFLLNIGVKEGWTPGYSYAIISNNEIIKGHGGYRELLPEKVANTEETIYDMASLTKVIVTNTILWRLTERKLIDLKDSVKKYLEDFPYDFITIEHLATHTSGLDSDIDYRIFNTKEMLLKEALHPKIVQKTGENSYYSDINYILLGLIFEKHLKMDLKTLAINEVFIPLNMTKSYFNPTDKEICSATEVTQDRGIVKGIVHDEKAYILSGIAGHAGLFSHVDDLTNFCQMVLNDGIFDGKQFLKKETIEKWYKKQYFDTNQEVNRGFGWIVESDTSITGKYTSENTISHSGFTGTSILIDRDNHFAFVYLTNRIHPTRNNQYFRYFRKKVIEFIYENVFTEKNLEKTFQKIK